jgi:hypothetical protein
MESHHLHNNWGNPQTPVSEDNMANRKRNNSISFRVSDKEKDLIETKMKMSKLPKAEFLIETIVNGKIEVKDISWEKEKYKQIQQLTKEINKIGININQIAKYCNQIGSVSHENYKEIKERLDEIWQLLRTTVYDQTSN